MNLPPLINSFPQAATPRYGRLLFALLLAFSALAAPGTATATPLEPIDVSATSARPAAEVNVLWPFIGISELKLLVPIAGEGTTRGELVTGLYADYAQVVRPDAGKVALLAVVLGYRQFIGRGFHVELTLASGVRHETHHPGDDVTLNDLYVRAWPMFGYQRELSERFYANARVGAGVLIYRQSHASEERKLIPAADVNLGVRF